MPTMIQRSLRLRSGDVGDGVALLQQALAWLGFSVTDDELTTQRFGESTKRALLGFQVARDLTESAIVDASTAQSLHDAMSAVSEREHFEVEGRVYQANGEPRKEAPIEVFSLGLRTAELLGVARTDASGCYRVSYPHDRRRPLEAGGSTLAVRVPHDVAHDHHRVPRANVLDPANAVVVVGPIYNAPAKATIDLYEGGRVHAGRSEFERVASLVGPAVDSTSAGTLTDDEIGFLAHETKLPVPVVSAFIRAERAASTSQSPAEAWFALILARPDATNEQLAAAAPDHVAAVVRDAMPLLIPQRDSAWLSAATAALRAYTQNIWAQLPGTQNPGYIAKLATADANVASAFASRLTSFTGDIDSFWASLSQDSVLGPHVPALQRATRVAVVVQYHEPLVEALLATIGNGDAAQVLPEIPDETWHQLVAKHGSPEGTNATDCVAAIRSTLESAYSTRFVAARVSKLGVNAPGPVRSFMRANADAFDLHGAPLDQLLVDRPQLADTDPAVLREVARLQRLHRAIRSVDDLATLASNADSDSPPIGSSGDIARLGRAEVRRRFGTATADADRVYDRAVAAHANAVALFGKLHPQTDRPVGAFIPPWLDKSRPHPKPIPLPQVMSIDFCGCVQCRSVLGPAAYLTDLLATVEHLYAPTGKPKNYLYYRTVASVEQRTLRRADLGTIHLDCANATTPLPYIDLVNELLEWHAAGKTVPFTYQTTQTAEELLVSPENVLSSVYDTTLASALFPWNLPYSLPLQTARAFLGYFHLERSAMMATLAGPTLTTTPIDRATERLQMNGVQRALITGTATPPPFEVWGLKATGNVVIDPADTVNTPPKNLPPKTWIEVLRYGMHLRLQSGFDQAALLATLHSRYLKHLAGTPVIDWPVTECSFDQAIVHLTEPQARTIHAFGRLTRQLGWAPEALDVVLDAFPGHISDPTIVALDGMVSFARRCKLPVVETLAWAAPLPTASETLDGTSLYARTFLSPAANPDDQAEFALAALGATPISDTAATVIASALGLSAGDLAAIRNAASTIGARVVDDQLDLPTLSRFYRIASLARATKCTVPQLLRLNALLALPALPLQPAAGSPIPTPAPADTYARIATLFDVVELVQGSGFSVEDILYIVTGEDVGARPLTPTDASIKARLGELYGDLSTIAHDVGWPLPSGTLPASFGITDLRSWLAVVATPDDAEMIVTVIATDGALPATASAAVGRVFAALEPDASAVAALVAAAQATLVTPGTRAPTSAARLDYTARAVLRGISLARQRRAIGKKLAEVFGLDDATTTVLLTEPRFATFELTTPGDLGKTFDATTFSSWFDGYRLLAKQTLIATRWALDAAELTTVVRLGAAGVWLDFDTIPLVPTLSNAPLRFSAWEQLARAVRMRDSVDTSTRSLFDALALANTGAPPADVIAALAAWRGIDPAVLQDAADALGITSGLSDIQTIERLFAATTITSTLGVSARVAQVFAAPTITLADARRIRDAVRGSRPIADWVSIAKPLQDVLRTSQRDALLAFLCARWHTTPRRLFDFLLIDVEMSDCQLTSRIQQAVCSVQLFIQRVTMHLELTNNLQPLEMSDELLDQWRKWTSTYETWVMARGVFLYPESTLDPALRPGKSEPFIALEKKIDQADVTSDLARDLLLEYLQELDEVALLETRAVYQEERFSSWLGGIIAKQDITHVLARTRAAPHRYYYRQLVDSRWTPWESVSLDISDDHVVLTVVDGRLFVYWSEFTTSNGDVTSPNEDIPGKDSAAAPTPSYEIRLAWSERKHGAWLPKRVTRESITTPDHVPSSANATSVPPNVLPEASEYSLHPILGSVARTVIGVQDFVGEDGDLWILVRCQRMRTETTTIPSYFVWDPPTTVVRHVDDVYLGWFVFAGCNGNVTTHDVTLSTYEAGNVGPLPTSPANTLGNDDWVQSADLQLLNAGFAQPILLQTGSARVAHGMAFTTTDETFFEPPMVWRDDRRSYAIFTNTLSDELAQFTDADLTDPSTIVANKTLQTTWLSLLGQKARPYRFATFFHPYVCRFIQTLNRQTDPWRGIKALLSPANQALTAPTDEPFASTYFPVSTAIEQPYPQERVEFGFDAAYASYNWELFFYIPILIADRLRANQRFDEALAWLQLVFDPTSADAAAKASDAWLFQPLRGRTELAIQDLLALLDYKGTNFTLKVARSLMTAQLAAWRQDALDPHAVAAHRPGAWMRAIVMRYVDTLIAWGDSLFRLGTIEGLNQATLMYLLALDVLGEPPDNYPSREVIAPMTYDQLAKLPLDHFSNALVQIENWVPPTTKQPPPSVPVPAGMTFYFCIPRNAKLDAYWDTLADRLYKVRHCLDIEGNLRLLAPFGELLDLLDKARGIGDALDGQGAIPTYRFPILITKANELASDVQRLGAALLSALEKKDVEALALLRNTHERALLSAVREVKVRQVDEATSALQALQRSQDSAQAKYDYYSSRPFTNTEEGSHIDLLKQALPMQDAAGSMESLGGFLHLIPDFDIGISGFCSSPVSTFRFGGTQLGQAMSAIGAALRTQAGHLASQAALAQTIGGYRRRADDWGLQASLAQIEIDQIGQQIAAAQVRLDVANKELANQELQMRQSGEVSAFLTGKFTSQELYGWLVEQLGVLYLRAYEIAYDLGKRAERAFQFERGELDASFLQPIYFDKLRKGLLAGERLALDLRRMEAAFFEQNRREFEITKHVSLVQDFPDAAIALLTLGTCTIELPESMFDRDHPGHYFRRIKSLALSLPCVGGAFASINAKVTIVKSKVRIDPDPSAPYPEVVAAAGDPRFGYRWATVESFAVSTGQNDAGLFEVNLRDDRYLPCEGAGAIAQIQIDLPVQQADFDPRRVSDAILHLRYTARDGGDALKKVVVPTVTLTDGVVFASARHDLPEAWQQFVVPAAGATTQSLSIDLRPDRFPYWSVSAGGPTVTPTLTLVFAAGVAKGTTVSATLTDPSGTSNTISFVVGDNAFTAVATTWTSTPGTWTLSIATAAIPEVIDDLAIVAAFAK